MIYLGCDHAGFELKEKIKEWLKEWGYEFEDKGAFEFDPQDDYPDFIRTAAKAVAKNPEDHKGIVLGGSGQGEAIVANRVKGVRTAVFYGAPEKIGEEIIRLSREHNNANVLSLGARMIERCIDGGLMSEDVLKRLIRLWLETPFPGEERHIRRIKQIDEED